ncbi:hypothetical protein H9Y04_27220 [Streptomyces sp. TRM66268-LWL]|uniref:Uncharacterized protein n=1 Tax=Streptomyces polyasparticus TaxID=2767826 RepID=A0ABR7SL77_9ACTN|nr:hypothetical protein [Streptomyces polyasparticus]MBC9716235.1 hypothetical protein [Streptomyces polyasparticus]
MKYTKAAAVVAGSVMAVGFASPAMADDAPRAAAPADNPKLVDTKTVNDSSVDADDLKDVVDVDVEAWFDSLTKVAKEARGTVKDGSDNVVKAANQTDVDATGKVNQDAKAKALGAMPHLGGLPIG